MSKEHALMRDLFRMWLEWQFKNRSKAHAMQLTRSVMVYFAECHDLPWVAITPEYVDEVLLKRSLSVKYRKRLLSHLASCFRWHLGQTRRLIDFNPIDQWQIWESGEETKKPYVPPVEDIEKLLAYIERRGDPRLLVVDVALELGVRIGEIIDTGVKPKDKWLRWVDTYLTDDPWVRLYTKKTGGRGWHEDHAPISRELSSRLAEWKLRSGDSEHVFPWTYTNLYWWLRRCCKSVRIRPFGWHSFRHFYAHYLAEQGIPYERIKDGLRHRNLSQTQAYLKSMTVDRSLVEHTFKRVTSGRYNAA